jgi:hypothetical protein
MNANPAGARDAFQLAEQLGLDPRDLHPSDVPVFERLKKSDGPIVPVSGSAP